MRQVQPSGIRKIGRAQKADKAMRQRQADIKALAGIIDQTVDFAMTLREHGGSISPPIDLAMDAEGESLANRLGHGFERVDVDDWENACRAAYVRRLQGLGLVEIRGI